MLELLFPSRCVGCGRRGALLCDECWVDMPLLSGVCGRCALPRGVTREGCRGCGRLSPALTSLRAACAFEGPARAAVLAFKFHGGRRLAPLLGEVMRQHLRRQPLRVDLVVPVPMASGRRRARGYNQAELLADEVAACVGGTVDAGLLERRERPAQQTLNAAERLVNLASAIHTRGTVPEARVLLVDDVATTGATLSACAEALASAGARSVRGLVFARDL